MRRYFYVGIVIILLIAFSLVGYGGYLNYSDSRQIANRMENRVLQVSGALVKTDNLKSVVDIDALKLYSENMTDATALIEGRIVKILVSKNDIVHKGDVIMILENEQIPVQLKQADGNVQKAQANFRSAISNFQRQQAVLAQAESSYQRQQRLMARNATSVEKLEAAQAEYRAALEAVRAAEAECNSAEAAIGVAESEVQQYQVQSARQEVRAPIDGAVLLLYKREGAYVQGGTPLALVGDFSTLYFSTTLENVEGLKVGDSATIEFNERTIAKAYDTEYSAGNLGRKERITAVIKDITPPLNESAVIRRMLWQVNNLAHILEPMTYNNLTMLLDRSHSCLCIPVSAMIDAEQNEVFVVGSDGTLEKRAIRTGISDGKNIEVLSGLNVGECVVLENFEGLSAGMKVDVVLEGGESHGGQ